MIRVLVTILFTIVSVFSLKAQYWFGVKVGGQMALHDYLDNHYRDTFDIAPNLNYQAGAIFSYTASRTYSVHGELYYKRLGRQLENNEFNIQAKSFQISHYLTAPFMFRVNIHFGNFPLALYVNGGIELNYWLGGNGGLRLDEFEEFFSEEELQDEYPVRYKIVFSERARKSESDRWLVDGNRLQYAITGGFGTTFTLPNGSRIVADARYTRAHSNMGFNGSPDFQWAAYYENFEYRPHQIALTLGYQMEYNAQLARKGKSTNKESNRRR